MKNFLPRSIQRLSEILSSLPGVGPKTANRLTFYLLSLSQEELARFGESFADLKKDLVVCSLCRVISESDPCLICNDPTRDIGQLAIVEEALDVLALEKARFRGRYHVLGGQISPLNNVGPNDLTIDDLLDRLTKEKIEEIILATDPSLEGEATALYIDEQIKIAQRSKKIAANLVVTRLARGLPVGGDLEYADELTLSRAIEGRRTYKD